MEIKDYIPIILGVLKDPKVIVTTIAMILIIMFANYIINYSKKPKKVRAKKIAAPKKVEPVEEESGSEEEGEA